MAKNQFFNWEKVKKMPKCNFTKKKFWFIWFHDFFLLALFLIFWLFLKQQLTLEELEDQVPVAKNCLHKKQVDESCQSVRFYCAWQRPKQFGRRTFAASIEELFLFGLDRYTMLDFHWWEPVKATKNLNIHELIF